MTVTTAGGTSATGTADKFTYTAAAPTVTSLSPTTGSTAGGTTVTITGTNLANATAVTFGEVAVTTFQSDTATQIVLTAPAGAAGAVDVTVATASGTSATSSADRFTYVAASSVSMVGLYATANSKFFLRNSDDTGMANTTVTYQPTSDTFVPIAGDWDGDGNVTIGLYDRTNGTFYLRNSNDPNYTATDATFQYGPSSTDSTWIPVVGDWNNSGKDQVGLYNQTTATFHLREVSGSSVNDVTFMYGPANSSLLPIAGKWTTSIAGDAVGLYDPNSSLVFLRNTNTTGTPTTPSCTVRRFTWEALRQARRSIGNPWPATGRAMARIRLAYTIRPLRRFSCAIATTAVLPNEPSSMGRPISAGCPWSAHGMRLR